MRGIFFMAFGLGLLLMVSGCSRKIVTDTTSEVKDSISIRYVPRIDTVLIPGENVTLTEYIECDSNTNKPIPKKIKASNGRAKVGVTIDETGKLTANGGCDSLVKALQLWDKEIFRLRHEKKVIVRTVTVTVYKTHWYDVPARFISIITLLVLTGYIYFKIK